MRRFLLLFMVMFCFAFAWGKKDRVQIQFFPSTLQVGENRALVWVRDPLGKPMTGLHLYLRTTMPGMEMPATQGILPWLGQEKAPGYYEIPFKISMDGLWQLDVLLQTNPGADSQKIFSLQKLVKPRKVSLEEMTFWAGTTAIFFLAFFFRRKIFTLRAALSFFLFFILVSLGWVYTRTLKKSEYPGQKAYESMGMKMNMNSPDMGMSSRMLSAPQPVEAEKVRFGKIVETATYPGTAQADLVETVYPRVEGWLLSMPFYPGMIVHAGEILGRLDSTQLQAETKQAWEKFMASKEKIKESRLELLSMENKVKEAKALLDYWKGEIKREAYLFQQGAVSRQEYDEEKSRYLEALARYRAALDEHHAFIQNVAQANALSQSDKAAFKAASTVQSYTVLMSHINGVVTKRLVNEGVLVRPGMEILQISKIDFIRLQAHVAESDLNQIHVGTPVLVGSPKLGSRIISAEVTSIFQETNPLTHTGTVEARIPNPHDLFFPGDYVVMTFVLNKKSHVLTVKASAIHMFQTSPSKPNLSAPKKPFVWVVDANGLAHRRFVAIGISNDERTEILSGLKPGEWVVDSGSENLQEMSPVSIVKGGNP
jgi:RND family efflux transporter MFP subunit